MDQSINFNIDEVKNDTDAELLKKLKAHWNYNPSSYGSIICEIFV